MESPTGQLGPDAAARAEAARLESILVERARSGDAQAFRSLVEQHADRAVALAQRVVRSADDAEEVAQDAFVRAWKALPGFRSEAAFSTWLHRIVVRCALDRAASSGARRERENRPPSEPAPSEADLEAPAGSGGEMEQLVATLPEAQRLAITLFYYQDRSVEEVARALELNVNTVKTHLRRARGALRTAWLRRSERTGR